MVASVLESEAHQHADFRRRRLDDFRRPRDLRRRHLETLADVETARDDRRYWSTPIVANERPTSGAISGRERSGADAAGARGRAGTCTTTLAAVI